VQESKTVKASTCTQVDGFSVPDALPGFDTTTQTWPCQYAGVLPGDSEGNSQLFFWMYRAADDDAPLTIWMNGGPGASSTFANFMMNGPMRITRTGDDISTGYDMHLA